MNTNKISFSNRHLGPSENEIQKMLAVLGYDTLEAFVAAVVPDAIRLKNEITLSSFTDALSESEAIQRLRERASKNKLYKSYIGQGYTNVVTPPVIQRNILENPSWYTAYTPYQPEIAQGRLEALFNFQTLVCELTGLPVSNASLLDEATAAAEALSLFLADYKRRMPDASEPFIFLVDPEVFPQTRAVLHTRAEPLGVVIKEYDPENLVFTGSVIGCLLQNPNALGELQDVKRIIAQAKAAQVPVAVAADLMSLLLIEPAGKLGASIVFGTTQNFGIPLGYGGPHAAYFAVSDEYKRLMPGRLIGLSKDADGNPAYRLALQTREQHIRREKATSNICTAQVLLAVMASMYAVYHGKVGLKNIAEHIHGQATRLASFVKNIGLQVINQSWFNGITISGTKQQLDEIFERAESEKINFLRLDDKRFHVALDETVDDAQLSILCGVLSEQVPRSFGYLNAVDFAIPQQWQRTSPCLSQPVFNSYLTESEFLRYLKRLEAKDLSLVHAMIPLGSCTMKLNATSEMLALSWPEISSIHPYVPRAQAAGYQQLCQELSQALCEVTGFAGVSLQPNSGAQGEYAGLLAIRRYLQAQGQTQRTVCLIPKSAHGTNPASAAMAGMTVRVIDCDKQGNVSIDDLQKALLEVGPRVAAIMVTYPSTHGVFESRIREITELVHDAGGLVYMDGANLNAQVGLTSPAMIGADVCHINLHKTFCIPHGGGGPGMGPIGVAKRLVPYLPGDPRSSANSGAVCAAEFGSASILTISWMYIAMMGAEGLTQATQVALLNANYIALKLAPTYKILYQGEQGRVAHECIIDVREFKESASIEADDFAKRFSDYGFHAPTVSFPVVGCLMIEPTESESLQELDRFIDAMLSMREEIRNIEQGKWPKQDNPLKNAPHTAAALMADEWAHPYTRTQAAFPSEFSKLNKFWPAVRRVDGAYGDRNLICTCAPIEEYR